MTREEINLFGFEEIEKRQLEIVKELETADAATIEAINAELDAIEERKAALVKEVDEKRKAAEAVALGAGKEIEKRKDERKMTNLEVRNTPEYIEAYAKYVKTGKDAEVRALLTQGVENGSVPVPAFVDEAIQTAWENDEIFSRISKTFVPGNYKVGFEVSATGAAVHVEGSEAPAEESLVLGVVDIVPDYIKKWITCSDKALAVGPRALLSYLYDEIEYQIVKAAADLAVAKILAAPTESTTEAVGVPKIDLLAGASSEDVLSAIIRTTGNLGSNARDRVLIANGTMLAALRIAALNVHYPIDPFLGMTPIQNDSLAAGTVIIGDLSGIRANLPEGGSVRFIFDELSLAERDLVKIVGKMLIGVELIAPKMFAVIRAAQSVNGGGDGKIG